MGFYHLFFFALWLLPSVTANLDDCQIDGDVIDDGQVCYFNLTPSPSTELSISGQSVVVVKDHITSVEDLSIDVDGSLVVFDMCDVDVSTQAFEAPALTLQNDAHILILCKSITFSTITVDGGAIHFRGDAADLTFSDDVQLTNANVFSHVANDLPEDPNNPGYPTYDTVATISRNTVECTAGAPLRMTVETSIALQNVNFHAHGSFVGDCPGSVEDYIGASITFDLHGVSNPSFDSVSYWTAGARKEEGETTTYAAAGNLLFLTDDGIAVPEDNIPESLGGNPPGFIDIYNASDNPALTRYVYYDDDFGPKSPTSTNCLNPFPRTLVYQCTGGTWASGMNVKHIGEGSGSMDINIDLDTTTFLIGSIESDYYRVLYLSRLSGGDPLTVHFHPCLDAADCDADDYFLMSKAGLHANDPMTTFVFPPKVILEQSLTSKQMNGVKELELIGSQRNWDDIDAPELEVVRLKDPYNWLTVDASKEFDDLTIHLLDSSQLILDGETGGDLEVGGSDLTVTMADTTELVFKGTVAVQHTKFELTSGIFVSNSADVSFESVSFALGSSYTLNLPAGSTLDDVQIDLSEGGTVVFDAVTAQSFSIIADTNTVEFSGDVVITGTVSASGNQFLFDGINVVADTITFVEPSFKFSDGLELTGQVKIGASMLLDVVDMEIGSDGSFKTDANGSVITGPLAATKFAPEHGVPFQLLGGLDNVVFNDGQDDILTMTATNVNGAFEVAEDTLTVDGSLSVEDATIALAPSTEIKISDVFTATTGVSFTSDHDTWVVTMSNLKYTGGAGSTIGVDNGQLAIAESSVEANSVMIAGGLSLLNTDVTDVIVKGDVEFVKITATALTSVFQVDDDTLTIDSFDAATAEVALLTGTTSFVVENTFTVSGLVTFVDDAGEDMMDMTGLALSDTVVSILDNTLTIASGTMSADAVRLVSGYALGWEGTVLDGSGVTFEEPTVDAVTFTSNAAVEGKIGLGTDGLFVDTYIGTGGDIVLHDYTLAITGTLSMASGTLSNADGVLVTVTNLDLNGGTIENSADELVRDGGTVTSAAGLELASGTSLVLSDTVLTSVTVKNGADGLVTFTAVDVTSGDVSVSAGDVTLSSWASTSGDIQLHEGVDVGIVGSLEHSGTISNEDGLLVTVAGLDIEQGSIVTNTGKLEVSESTLEATSVLLHGDTEFVLESCDIVSIVFTTPTEGTFGITGTSDVDLTVSLDEIYTVAITSVIADSVVYLVDVPVSLSVVEADSVAIAESEDHYVMLVDVTDFSSTVELSEDSIVFTDTLVDITSLHLADDTSVVLDSVDADELNIVHATADPVEPEVADIFNLQNLANFSAALAWVSGELEISGITADSISLVELLPDVPVHIKDTEVLDTVVHLEGASGGPLFRLDDCEIVSSTFLYVASDSTVYISAANIPSGDIEVTADVLLSINEDSVINVGTVMVNTGAQVSFTDTVAVTVGTITLRDTDAANPVELSIQGSASLLVTDTFTLDGGSKLSLSSAGDVQFGTVVVSDSSIVSIEKSAMELDNLSVMGGAYIHCVEKCEIKVSDTLVMDNTSYIDAVGTSSLVQTCDGSGGELLGGNHAGCGGQDDCNNDNDIASGTYGDVLFPESPGSRCDASTAAAVSHGGGAVVLRVGTLTAEGYIDASASDPADEGDARGGASGGSILIVAGLVKDSTLLLEANGGNAVTDSDGSEAFGGSGGRIALYAEEIEDSDIVYQAYGGSGTEADKRGSVGTVVEPYKAGLPLLRTSTPNFDETTEFSTAYIKNDPSITQVAVSSAHPLRFASYTPGDVPVIEFCYVSRAFGNIDPVGDLVNLTVERCDPLPTLSDATLSDIFDPVLSTHVSQLGSHEFFHAYRVDDVSAVTPVALASHDGWNAVELALFRAAWEGAAASSYTEKLTLGWDLTSELASYTFDDLLADLHLPEDTPLVSPIVTYEPLDAEHDSTTVEGLINTVDKPYIPYVLGDQPIQLSLDLWAIKDGETVPFQRGLPMSADTFYIGDSAGDIRVDNGYRRAPLSGFSPYDEYDITGVQVEVEEVTWTLYGVPSPEFLSLDAQADPAHTTDNPHEVIITGSEAYLSIPSDTLIPGYVYHVTAEADAVLGMVSEVPTNIDPESVTMGTRAIGMLYVHLPQAVELSYQASSPLSYDELFTLTTASTSGGPFLTHNELSFDNKYDLLLAASVDFVEYQPKLTKVWEHLLSSAFSYSSFSADLAGIESVCASELTQPAEDMTHDALRSYHLSQLVGDGEEWCEKKSAVFDDYVVQFSADPYSSKYGWEYSFFVESSSEFVVPSPVAEPEEYAAAVQLYLQNNEHWSEIKISTTTDSSIDVSFEAVNEMNAYLDFRFFVVIKDTFDTYSIASLDKYSFFGIDGDNLTNDLNAIMGLLDDLEQLDGSTVSVPLIDILEYYMGIHNALVHDATMSTSEWNLSRTVRDKLLQMMLTMTEDNLDNMPSIDPEDPEAVLSDQLIVESLRNILMSISSEEGHTTVPVRDQLTTLTSILEYSLPKGFLSSDPDVDPSAVSPFPAEALQLVLDVLEQLNIGGEESPLTDDDIAELFRTISTAALRNVAPGVGSATIHMVPSIIANNGNHHEISVNTTTQYMPSFIFSATRVDHGAGMSATIHQPSEFCDANLGHPSCIHPPSIELPPTVFPSSGGPFDVVIVQMRNPGFQEDSHNLQQASAGTPSEDDADEDLFDVLSNDLSTDALEHLGLAARIVSIKIYDRDGNEVPVVGAVDPIIFTVPYDALDNFDTALNDLVATRPGPLTFVCPTSDQVPIEDNPLSIPVTYGGETVTVVKSGILPSGGPDSSDTPYAVLRRDCGDTLGEQEFVCVLDDPEEYIYECPEISEPEPVCVYWDDGAEEWSDEGCSAVASTSTEVTCECDHMTSFSTRFRGFGTPTKSVFSSSRSSGTISGEVDDVFIAIGLIVCLLFVGWIIVGIVDYFAARRFLRYLYHDKEVQFLRHVTEKSGRSFVLDRIQDTWRYVFGSDEAKNSVPDAPGVGPLTADEYMSPAHGSITAAAIEHVAVASKSSARPSDAALYALVSTSFDQYGVVSDSQSTMPATVNTSSESAESISISTSDDDSSFVSSTKEILGSLAQGKATNGVSFSNYWLAKGLLFKLWLRRILFNHSWLAVFAPYNPKFTRSYRLLLFSIEFIGSLFFAMLYYNHMHEDVEGVLPVLSASDHFLLAFIVTLNQMAISLVLSFLLKMGAQERFERRYSVLYEEYRKRNLAETFLSQFTGEQLRDAAKKYLSELADKGEIVPGDKALEVPSQSKEDKEPYYWVNAPQDCVSGYASFLSCIARHPGQKDAYVKSQKERIVSGGDVELTPTQLSDLLVYYTHRTRNASLWTNIKAYFTPSTQFVDAHLHSGGPLTPETLASTVESALKGTVADNFTFATILKNFFYVYCAPMNVIALICSFTYLAWSFAYIIMFGSKLIEADHLDFFGAWGINLAFAFLLKEPFLITLHFAFVYFVLPVWYSALAYLPRVGPYLLRKTRTSQTTDSHMDTLSRRLEQLTIARATGATNGMTPSEAAIAFCSPITVASTLLNLNTQYHGEQLSEIDASIASEKRELIVQTYVLSNLHVVEHSQQNN